MKKLGIDKKDILFKIIAISIGLLIALFLTEVFLRVQNIVQLDGFKNQYPGDPILHHGSQEFNVTNYGTDCNGERIKLLLLGDSWMMPGYSLSETIEKEFANKSKKCVEAINGGTSSYAPTLYLLKGRMAYKKYGKFDYIIVNIDETDIGDEWLRYRIPAVYDDKGRIIAVPFKNDIESLCLWNGKVWAENSRLYTVRLIKFTLFYKVFVPMLYEFTGYPNHFSSLMKYVFAPDARSKYKKEHSYFEKRLLRLTTELGKYINDPTHLYLTHHPHLRGLVKKMDDGLLYLPIVSEMLARLHEKTGVKVLDARNHIQEIHNGNFSENTYAEKDRFSHLSSQGETEYGKWIVDQIDIE